MRISTFLSHGRSERVIIDLDIDIETRYFADRMHVMVISCLNHVASETWSAYSGTSDNKFLVIVNLDPQPFEPRDLSMDVARS